MSETANIACVTCEHKHQYGLGLLYHPYNCKLSKSTPPLQITRNMNRHIFKQDPERPDECPLIKNETI